MTKKQKIAGAVVAALALITAYLVSPLIAANALRSAAQAGDADKLQRLVDFPSVREGLKGQLSAMFMQSMQSDAGLRDNPFGGLAALMAPAFINQAIDSYVTPEGISAMMSADKPGGTSGLAAAVTGSAQPHPSSVSAAPAAKTATAKPSFQYRYKDLDTYVISSVSGSDTKARFNFVLHRQGLFGWRLTRIELPKDLMAAPAPAAPIAAVAPTEPAPEVVSTEPRALLDRWAQENEACRDGSGDDPATDRACEARTVTDGELERAGWCYGENAAYGYQSEWRPCGSPKFASTTAAEAAADAEQAVRGQ